MKNGLKRILVFTIFLIAILGNSMYAEKANLVVSVSEAKKVVKNFLSGPN